MNMQKTPVKNKKGDFMLTTIIRTLILYVAVILSVRIMGKRQIGELQPVELVVTILISEIAAIPIQDNAIPLVNSLVPLMLLTGLEIVSSVFSMKSVRFRLLSEGNPLIVIRNGVLDQRQLKRLRFTVDDILAALTQKDVFDINDVEYAVMETNGSVSVLLKPEKRNTTPENLDIKTVDNGIPCAVIIDGRVIKTAFKDCGINLDELNSILIKHHLKQDELVLLTVDRNKRITAIKKEEKK